MKAKLLLAGICVVAGAGLTLLASPQPARPDDKKPDLAPDDSATGRLAKVEKQLTAVEGELKDVKLKLVEATKAIDTLEKQTASLSGQQNKIETREVEIVPRKGGEEVSVEFSGEVVKDRVAVCLSGYVLYGHFWGRNVDAAMRPVGVRVDGKKVFFKMESAGQGGHDNSRVRFTVIAWIK